MRLDHVCAMLAMGHSRSEIKRSCADRFNMSPRSVERYILQAQEAMLEAAGVDRALMVAQARATYLAVIQSECASHTDRIKAQARLDRLFGLEQPRRLEHSGPDGGPIRTDSRSDATPSPLLTDPDLRAKASALAVEAAKRIEAQSNANEVESTGK